MSASQVMAVLNLSADSFHKKSTFEGLRLELEDLLQANTDIIDVGLESSNPSGADVDLATQRQLLDTFLQTWEKVCRSHPGPFPKLSLDSWRQEMVAYWLEVQKSRRIYSRLAFINDISGLADLKLVQLAVQGNCSLISMFNYRKKNPRALIDQSAVLSPAQMFAAVVSGLKNLADRAMAGGLPADKLILDPGMGFFLGSNPQFSFEILRRLEEIRAIGFPVCVSVTHKSFLEPDLEPAERGLETALAECKLLEAGVDIIRTHDVRQWQRIRRFWQRLNP